ncbi:hypothetical protein ACFL43_00315 [Thermodesulfobacteriota bacterium]
MRKIIKQIGNSLGIIFNKEDQEAYKLKEKDVIDVKLKKVKKDDE